MNIWIICQYAGSPSIGMNYRPYYFGREFSRAGHSVTVISGSYSHQFQKPPVVRSLYTRDAVDGLDYLWIRTPVYRSSSDPKRIIGWLSFTAGLTGISAVGLEKPDVIIVSSPVPYPIYAARKLAKKHGAVLIFEERDLWPISLRMLGGYSSKHPILLATGAAQRYGVNKADAVVSPLPGAITHYQELGFRPRQFEWISNGVDPGVECATDLPPHVERILAESTNALKLMYAGSFHARNSASVFADAMRVLEKRGSPVIMYFLGKDGGGLGMLKEAAKGLNNIRFLDPIPRSSVPKALEHVDVCCAATKNSPLYKYGISLTKLYDYMAAGKPVILATSAEGDPVSEHGCGIKTSAEDPEAIADAIEKLEALGSEGRKALGYKGKTALNERYTYTILASRYLALMEGLLDRRASECRLRARRYKG